MDEFEVHPVPSSPRGHAECSPRRYRVERHSPKQLPYRTRSVCPACLLDDKTITVVEAEVYEDNGRVMIRKTCDLHGDYNDVYWSSAELFHRSMRYWYRTIGLDNPRTERSRGCPFDCGQCPGHLAHTALGIIDVTNRCDLRCPVCFAGADDVGMQYEPSPRQILDMLTNLRENLPVPCPAVQFAGGEPTLSDHLPTYIRWAKQLGFDHVMVATNGIRMSRSAAYVGELRAAGMNTVYLQFDGVTRQSHVAARGVDLRQVKDRVLDNCRAVNLDGVILVPTIIRGVNDDQLGDMVRFAVSNRDIVRCINFQPVSITGRIDYARRQQMRVTIPDAIQGIAAQTDGRVTSEDWYPVASMMCVGRALGLMKEIPTVELHAHFACGMATFLVVDTDGSYMPITRVVDLEKILETLEDICTLYADEKKLRGIRAKYKLLGFMRHVKQKNRTKAILSSFLKKGTYDSLAGFMHNVIMLGMMHFQDPFNIDLERVRHCTINYATPDGRIIPFCTYNTFHRKTVEHAFSRSTPPRKAHERSF